MLGIPLKGNQYSMITKIVKIRVGCPLKILDNHTILLYSRSVLKVQGQGKFAGNSVYLHVAPNFASSLCSDSIRDISF